MSLSTHPNQIQNYLPYVTEQTSRGERTWDLYSRMLKDRIVFLQTEINDQVSTAITAQLLYLESEDPDKDVMLYINSPGGSITSLWAIYDTMQYIKPDVSTVGQGMVASAAAVILAAGAPGKRIVLPHTRVMIHQPHGGSQGRVTDIETTYKLMKGMREEINERLAFHTGQDIDQIEEDTDKTDLWFSAQEALEYGSKGIADRIIENREAPTAVAA